MLNEVINQRDEIRSVIEKVVDLELFDLCDDQLDIEFKPLDIVEVNKAQNEITQALRNLGYEVIQSGKTSNQSKGSARTNSLNQLWFTIK